MEKQALFIFQKGHFRSNSIKDGLFNSTFYLKKHLIPTSSFGEESEAADTISVLVIRPRSLNFRILKKLSLEDLQPEIFLSNLEERVQNLLDDPGSSENSPGHISRDLELILEALPDFDGGCQKELITDETAQIEEYESSPIKCMKCLLYRLLIVCTQLKNTGQGLRVLLHISKLKDQAIFRRCQTCGVNLNHPNPAIIFANFICLASGNAIIAFFVKLKLIMKYFFL